MSIETPSGKGAGDENFPVGSFLLPKHLRPHIARYYAFARAIDDIADNPDLPANEKSKRLAMMDDVVSGRSDPEAGLEVAARMRESLIDTDITARHCSDLVDAFQQDVVKNRYADWDEVIGYCMRSASPVGRYLLDLHGENNKDYVYSDALCNALQVINHLQDCGKDFQQMNRVYLPEPWLNAAGAKVEDLSKPHASPGVRAVIDLCLEGTRELLVTADKLPGALNSKRLAMESATIITVAHKLVDELSRRDPLAERIELTKAQYAWCLLRGCAQGLTS